MILHNENDDVVAKTNDITVRYENEEVVVLDKPAGLVVHADGKTSELTLADWLLKHYPDIQNVGESWKAPSGEVILRPGIVHRLDRETSGVLIVAKTQLAFLNLKKQFQNRTIQKTYNAFVYGVLKEDNGVIDRPIGKSAKDFRLRSAQRGARGTLREAITEYIVLQRGSLATFVEARPQTGRTHQIRVHFKAIHHPVVCDALYAPKHDCILGFRRLALHARKIAFTLPGGERVTVEAPLPQVFTKALTAL